MALGSGRTASPDRAERNGETAEVAHLPSTLGARRRRHQKPWTTRRCGIKTQKIPTSRYERIMPERGRLPSARAVAVKPISRECGAAGEALTTDLRESVRYADPLGLISESRLIPQKIAALIWRRTVLYGLSMSTSLHTLARSGMLPLNIHQQCFSANG